MISVESHSKQIKLLNQYIVALEKQIASARKQNEEHQKGSTQYAEDVRVMNEDINKLRNQNGQLKFNIARQDDVIRRLMPFEKQFLSVREQLQKSNAEINRILIQLQQTQESNKANEEKSKNLEQELKRKNEESTRDKQEIEQLKKTVIEKDKQKQDITQLYNSEKKSTAVRISALEASNNDLIKVKNDAISKLNKDLQELKLRYNKDMTSNSQTRNSLGDQIKQLINSSNQSKTETIAVKKELVQTKQALDKKTAQCDDFSSKLKAKTSDYDNLIKKSNEQKTNLLRNIQRLDEQKNKLEAINNACKGDINQNTKALSEALKRIEELKIKLFEANQDISLKKDLIVQNQNEISKLTLNLSDANQQILKKTEETKVREEYIVVLKAEIERANHEIEQLETHKSNNLNNIGQLDQKTNKLKSDLSNKQKQLQEKDKIIDDNKVLITKMIDEIHHLEVERKDQQFNITKQTADIQSKSETIARLSSIRTELESKLQKYKNQSDQLDEEVKKLNEELQLLKKQKSALQAEKLELTTRASQILKQKLGDKDLLTKQISSRDKKIQELTSKYEKLENLYTTQTKSNAQIIKKLQAEKNNSSTATNEANAEIESLKKKIQQLQSNLAKTKDTFDLTMQEYNTYRKKKQTETDQLTKQLKESQKKSQKRANKIQELSQEIIALQSTHSSQRKNLGDSQRQQIERHRAKFNKQILQLKNQHDDAVSKMNLQAEQLRQLIEKNSQQYDQKLKNNKEEYSNKQKMLNQAIKRLQNDKQVLQKEVKRLNLTTINENQSKSNKQLELEVIKKSMERLQMYSKQQKNTIQQLNKLVESKIKQVQSLESSNAMLRKQVIIALSGEQTSRKELIEAKSKVSSIMINSGSRNSLFDYAAASKMETPINARSSVLYKKKKTSFTNKDEVESGGLSKIRTKEKTKTLGGGEKMKSSLVEDLSESNFAANEMHASKD